MESFEKRKEEYLSILGEKIAIFCYMCYNFSYLGPNMVSTGLTEYGLQVEAYVNASVKITGNKIKNAFATLFSGRSAVAFA